MFLTRRSLKGSPITFEQKYPTATIEEKILINTLGASTKDDKEFCKKLVTWADVIRKTYFDGGVDEIISTRRLVHIIQAFKIFGKKVKSH